MSHPGRHGSAQQFLSPRHPSSAVVVLYYYAVVHVLHCVHVVVLVMGGLSCNF